ncbi:MAG TPA: hypothetical protein VHM24_14735 [Gemmatimonadaceae bacterium]|nr:hypothetical protein [Gemmatimonadaceae bacterium]
MRSLGFRFLWFAAPGAIALPAALQSQSLGAGGVPCKGQIISRIEISARPPFEVKGSGLNRRIARQLTELHATTNPEVISRFLALKPGMACSELRRLESERILRAQPYLADATVTAFADEAGGVYLSVVTVDEISIVLGGGGSGAVPYLRKFRLGEENLMGEAMSVVGTWSYSEDFRDNFSARLMDYQFVGRPYQLMLEGARNELGGNWGIELSHPFLTDLQRVSWRTTAGAREDYRYFRRDANVHPAIMLQRSYADIGGVARVGPPGKLALLGASISYEDEMPQPFPTFVLNGVTARDTTQELFNRYVRHRVTRINALAGLRDVRYMRVTGFESLDGTQDVRKGFEAAGVLGRGMQLFGGLDQDLFASANIYAGGGTPVAFAAAEATIEGRRDQDSERWDGILVSGRFATYVKPATRHTVLTSFEWSEGQRQRIPFQLTLADKDGGPRGYQSSWLGGGRRVVLRLEDRVFVGHVKQLASVGLAPFADLAKLSAGDVPFGVTTGINASVGLSLLASVPPRSQRMWRLDLAFPLERSSGARVRLRLMNRDFSSIFWKEPKDVQRNRERSIPTSVFNWP